MIGYPPWDMIRADSSGADARSRALIDAATVIPITRDAGISTARSDGHANRYRLFVERAIRAHAPRRPIWGSMLPSGLATDHGNASLRR